MFLQKRKRAHLTLEEKIWIVGRKQENAKLTNAMQYWYNQELL